MDSALSLRPATAEDIPRLAELNLELLEDEGYRVRPGIDALIARHNAWMASAEWWQDVLEADGETVGYLAYRPETEPLDPEIPEVYLRQFCIARDQRGKGYGRAGFKLFLNERLGHGTRVTLDVMESNPAGQAFWRTVGTSPYFQRMEIVTG
ncbi:GNAT family N-acetyltransferase [Nisaea acidiphila]|uniref:GNAT family N-acetyltransferase n=1 Tax=Nisaea acidiphila TaxID=1862145 RepID=A0A9J7AT19_9PROT|nr:GNAT family N-acetyltransferase [Nisaea acidiphila]UUX49476.1 GNAT family N-acetyltransferase [Nisaea acidiphila]